MAPESAAAGGGISEPALVEIAAAEVFGEADVGFGEAAAGPFRQLGLAQIRFDLHLEQFVILLGIGGVGGLAFVQAIQGVGLLFGAVDSGGRGEFAGAELVDEEELGAVQLVHPVE